MDVKEIVQILKKEMRGYVLSKRKYIEKPTINRLPLVHRKCTYAQLKTKYPEPWAFGQITLLKRVFGHGFSGRTYGSQSARPSRRSR